MSTAPPSKLFPDLLQRYAGTGADAKAFADAVPRCSSERIMKAYSEQLPGSPEQLRAFVDRWFELPEVGAAPAAAAEKASSLATRIAELWPNLVRLDAAPRPGESRIALPHRYLVPGGIFRESYYWDTYFTLVGLAEGDAELREDAVRNLAYLIDRFGFVPNGNRTYYLTRSQPPVFYAAVALLDEQRPSRAFAAYLPQLRREHAFWTAGEEDMLEAHNKRVVRLKGGEVLNRYWDDGDWPRDERYREDVALAASAPSHAPAEFYREIRAACESGWDFSSRWFADQASMQTIIATAIVPSDLNALLYGLENAISAGAREAGDHATATEFADRADARRKAMNDYLWSDELGFFDDFDVRTGKLRACVTPACLFPLLCGMATAAQAQRTAELVERSLLAPGGLLTSTRSTGEQWDSPNGWAPLHWIAVEGLERYGLHRLAREIARRWLATVDRVYKATGRLVEKYDVLNATPGGGGEYPLQDGFGWTNGVTLALLRKYPEFDPG